MGSGLLLGVESFSRLRFRLWERFVRFRLWDFNFGFGAESGCESSALGVSGSGSLWAVLLRSDC